MYTGTYLVSDFLAIPVGPGNLHMHISMIIKYPYSFSGINE